MFVIGLPMFLHRRWYSLLRVVQVRGRNTKIEWQSNNPDKVIVERKKFNLQQSLESAFLPKGYPGTVAEGYIVLCKWNFLQIAFGTISGVLATQALLHSVGLSKGTIAMAAAVNWIIKDGLGQLGGVLYASLVNQKFDSDPKRYRLKACILYQVALAVDISTVAAPHLFIPLASLSNVAKNIAWIAMSASTAQINKGLTRGDNMGDITAKAASQGTCASLLGTISGVFLGSIVDTSILYILCMSFACSSLSSLFSCYNYCQSVIVTSLNQRRFEIIAKHYLDNNTIPSPKTVRTMQSPNNLVATRDTLFTRSISNIKIGHSISAVPKDDEFNNCWSQYNLMQRENYFIYRHSGEIYLWFNEASSLADAVKGLLHCVLVDNEMTVRDAHLWLADNFNQFYQCLEIAGWNTSNIFIGLSDNKISPSIMEKTTTSADDSLSSTLLHPENCFADTPIFRQAIDLHQQNALGFESVLKAIQKSVSSSLDHHQDLAKANNLLSNQFLFWSTHESLNPYVVTAFNKFGETLQEIEQHRGQFIHQTKGLFLDAVNQILKQDITHVKDTRKKYDKWSEEVESSMQRYLAKKHRDSGLPEAAQDVADSRREFHRTCIDYVVELNRLNTTKKMVFVETSMAYMYSQFAFFHQQYELMKDLEPFMRELAATVHKDVAMYEKICVEQMSKKEPLIADMIDRYNPLTPRDITPLTPEPFKEGYLLKKTTQRVRQSWNRRFFSLKGPNFCYYSLGKEEENSPTIPINLKLCSVKIASDSQERRFCFELLSPQKSFVLQAECEADMMEWVGHLQQAISLSLHHPDLLSPDVQKDANPLEFIQEVVDERCGVPDKLQVQELIAEIMQLPGNEQCADCGHPNPSWVSLNLGVIVCIDCSGIHRSLGVQLSKIRSLKLDHWELELLQTVKAIGNSRANSLFLVNQQEMKQFISPVPNSDRSVKEKWIQQKYVKKLFLSTNAHDSMQLLLKGLETNDPFQILTALIHGASVDSVVPDHPHHATILESAIENQSLAISEFLINWNASLGLADDRGWTPMHYAAAFDQVKVVNSLLKKNAPWNILSSEGKEPLDLAVARAHVDVVTILRLFKFEKEQYDAALVKK